MAQQAIPTPLPSSPSTEFVTPKRYYNVVGRRFYGLQRTNPAWLDSYIDLRWPHTLSDIDARRLQARLMTTLAFTQVKVGFEAIHGSLEQFELVVYVEERWTTIPVIRAVYGGGTPLRVFGAYDTHAFGRLVTLGAESRQYGDAPPGFVAFAKDPRHDAGRYHLGAEFWRDFRRRSVYAQNEHTTTGTTPAKAGEELGAVSTAATITRINLLRPLTSSWFPGASSSWRAGVDLYGIHEAPSVFDPVAERKSDPAPSELGLRERKVQYLKLMPALAYDDVEADILHFEGSRWTLRGGPLVLREFPPHGTAEFEGYVFQRYGQDVNLAIRGMIGTTTFKSLGAQYYLGGLDTIRGLPDGAVYGTKAAYLNTEVRYTAARYKFLWLQTLAFVDTGTAADQWRDATGQSRAATGVGLRLAVPQVYRLILRFDYAWSIDGSGARGITAGLNQFIDPYKPL